MILCIIFKYFKIFVSLFIITFIIYSTIRILIIDHKCRFFCNNMSIWFSFFNKIFYLIIFFAWVFSIFICLITFRMRAMIAFLMLTFFIATLFWFPFFWFPFLWFPFLWFPFLWFPFLWFRYNAFRIFTINEVCLANRFESVTQK